MYTSLNNIRQVCETKKKKTPNCFVDKKIYTHLSLYIKARAFDKALGNFYTHRSCNYFTTSHVTRKSMTSVNILFNINKDLLMYSGIYTTLSFIYYSMT